MAESVHPPVLRPMLSGATGIPTVGGRDQRSRYLIEPKWDGVRAMVTVHGGEVRLASRNDHDVTAAYPELAHPPPVLVGRSAVLDGEVVAIGARGRAEFGLLQRRMHVRHPSEALVAEVPVDIMVFDVLWLDGDLLTDMGQEQRREILAGLAISHPPWITSPLLDLPADEDLVATVRDLGLEGFMMKRADAPYLPGRRSDAWRKVKCVRRREFVVGGWLEGRRSRTGGLGSLALGVWDAPVGGDRHLRFVGMAGSGISQADVEAFRSALVELSRRESPFSGPTPPGVRYLEPVLVAEVTFSEVTAAGTLRHPVLEGFRTDVAADDVVIDGELPELTQ
jgi:bifunctional non-homologous end joining protein LigD